MAAWSGPRSGYGSDRSNISKRKTPYAQTIVISKNKIVLKKIIKINIKY